ncbi:MAG: tRNA 4-thiouridine(8) synthase ThiI [Clostridiales bacterium]|jgi:thiamine biosynthesis protein ThiI|nr:tRNA 4-thiouridine(8) synthase ThiI [Clostridiales bacterium]
MENVILLRYGEIHLKGQNRPYFERVLQSNIEKALEAYKDVRVIKAQGRYFIENVGDDPRIYDTISRIFGIISFSPALRVAKNMEDIQEAAELQLKDAIDAQGGLNGLSFKVESRRSDKTFPLTSMELSRTIGAHLLRKFPGIKVDVHNPMVTIHIEVREWTYMYHRIIPGAGGMPVGTNGKAVLLLSGGIDSPVAGWMISKRGVELTAVHFHSFPYTSDRSKEKVIDLCRILTGYCGPIRLYVVPFTRIQQELYQKCPDKMLTLLMRRFMMKIGEIIARREEAGVLITGESLGQVASQTLESLSVTDDAVSMPVLRPLIGMDKIEIIDMAKKIDTYETSILPYEDCCTIFVPKHPLTRPRLDKVREAEALVDGKELIEDAVANAEVIEVKE